MTAAWHPLGHFLVSALLFIHMCILKAPDQENESAPSFIWLNKMKKKKKFYQKENSVCDYLAQRVCKNSTEWRKQASSEACVCGVDSWPRVAVYLVTWWILPLLHRHISQLRLPQVLPLFPMDVFLKLPHFKVRRPQTVLVTGRVWEKRQSEEAADRVTGSSGLSSIILGSCEGQWLTSWKIAFQKILHHYDHLTSRGWQGQSVCVGVCVQACVHVSVSFQQHLHQNMSSEVFSSAFSDPAAGTSKHTWMGLTHMHVWDMQELQRCLSVFVGLLNLITDWF